MLVIALALFAAAAAFALVIGAWRSALLASSGSWHRMADGAAPAISVVVPARDEERGIALVLQHLHAQQYPRPLLEVIVVDDGSSDRTVAIAQGMQRSWPQLKVIANAGAGKKAAITTGVEASAGSLIVLTDADGRSGPERIAAIAAHWMERGSSFVVAPVWTEGRGLLGALQEAEQSALLGAALGSAALGRPILAYGANLAFAKAAFHAVGGYEGDRFASGDDVFLLMRMLRAGLKVSAVLDPSAVVLVEAEGTWGGFFRQRLRWAGKMRGAGGTAMLGGLFVLALPWLLVWATIKFDFVGSMGGQAFFSSLLIGAAWLCWLLPILGLVRDSHRLLGKPCRALVALVGLVAFSAYAPAIAALSLVARPFWKGRRV